MLRTLSVVALLFVAGCKKDPPPAPPAPPPASNPDVEFWNWVRAHTAELKSTRTGQEPVLNELSAELNKAAPGVVFELGVNSTPFEFILSADGVMEHFGAVMRLTAAAGEVPGMKVVAFRQRKKIDGLELRVDEQKIAANNVMFVSSKDKDPAKLALDLYIEGYDEKNAELVERGAFLLLDTAIGEYDMETKVGGIRFHGFPAPAGAKALPQLAAEIDALKK